MSETVRLDGVMHHGFDAIFYPGGHGPLWDLAEDKASIELIKTALEAGKPVALVCHAPGVLRHAKAADGNPLVDGKDVTGFTNTEEEAVGLTEVVPFLVEEELKRRGSGFVGQALTEALRSRGDRVTWISREPGTISKIRNSASRSASSGRLDGCRFG